MPKDVEPDLGLTPPPSARHAIPELSKESPGDQERHKWEWSPHQGTQRFISGMKKMRPLLVTVQKAEFVPDHDLVPGNTTIAQVQHPNRKIGLFVGVPEELGEVSSAKQRFAPNGVPPSSEATDIAFPSKSSRRVRGNSFGMLWSDVLEVEQPKIRLAPEALRHSRRTFRIDESTIVIKPDENITGNSLKDYVSTRNGTYRHRVSRNAHLRKHVPHRLERAIG
jgi:hypothetical protein